MYLWCKATFSVIPVPVDTVEYGEEWFLFKKCCLSKVLLVSQTQDACAHAGRHEERHACTKILSRCHSLHSGSLRSADRACSSRARGAPQCGAHHRLLQSRAAQTARVPPSVTAAQPPPRAAGTAARGILPRPLALPLAHPRHCPCSPSPFLSLAHPRRRVRDEELVGARAKIQANIVVAEQPTTALMERRTDDIRAVAMYMERRSEKTRLLQTGPTGASDSFSDGDHCHHRSLPYHTRPLCVGASLTNLLIAQLITRWTRRGPQTGRTAECQNGSTTPRLRRSTCVIRARASALKPPAHAPVEHVCNAHGAQVWGPVGHRVHTGHN